MASLRSLFLNILAFQSLAQCSPLTLHPPPDKPDSKPVDHGFVGLGMNAALFPELVGNKSHPNAYSRNLIDTIAERSGTVVNVRVGGTVFDHVRHVEDQKKPVKEIAPEAPGGDIEFLIGPSYFDSFGAIPNLRYVLQVPLATGSMDNSVKIAELGVKAIGNANLEAIEIGNEPFINRYKSVDEYIEKWLQYASAISGNITSLPSGPIYQGLSLASEVKAPIDIPTLFNKGLDRDKNIKTVSHHFYEVFPGRNGDPPVRDTPNYLQRTLLNHEHTIKTTNQFKSNIKFLAQNYPDIPLVLGEIGSGLSGGNDNETQKQQIEASLGTAVWTADLHLHTMSIGIKGVSNQLGPWTFSPWSAKPPKPDLPSVRPTYYGLIFATDFLGSKTSSPVRVREIVIPEDNHTSAYAAYQGSELSKVAVLNLELWDPLVSTGPRPEKQVTLEVPTTMTSATVHRLTGPGTFAQSGVTWGGESWTYENNGKGVVVKQDTQILPVRQGRVTVGVKASEAVIVTLESSRGVAVGGGSLGMPLRI